jgi:hypothetical protein
MPVHPLALLGGEGVLPPHRGHSAFALQCFAVVSLTNPLESAEGLGARFVSVRALSHSLKIVAEQRKGGRPARVIAL